MSASPANLGFPRKVVAYYLLVSMGVICWLAVSLVLISHRLVNSQSVDSRLGSIGKTAAAIELSYLRHGHRQFQHLVDEAKANCAIQYASIVDLEGVVLAHTDSRLIGEQGMQKQGSMLRWGSVTGVRFEEDGRTFQEYEVPLIVKSVQIGLLKVAFSEASLQSTFLRVAGYAPLAMLIPVVLVFLGARSLRRMTDCLQKIQSQLHAFAVAPPGSELVPKKLPLNSGVVLGWNRLAESIESTHEETQGDSLQSRLAKVRAEQSQNEMAQILQNLNEGIVLTDLEGRVTFANRAIAALLDAEAAESPLEGTLVEERLLEEMPDLANCPLFDAESSHRAVVAEGHCQDGENGRIVRVSRQPIVGDSQRGLVWTLRDVTQQKLADKMRDQFIDTATHELRTPLTNIKAYAEMLASSRNIDVEQQKEFCNIINSEVTRLARFVDDLLSISSMEVGSLAAERQKVDTERLFDEVIAKVKPMMEQKNIQFEVRLPEKMQDLVLDKEKMMAVVVNLLGNAAKYTPESGHVALKVKIEDEHLQIAVEDTGVGISEEELPKVFDKFFRSSDSRVQDVTGTGLGLSLALEVVRMHGGEIDVESTLEKGSTFTVKIPVEQTIDV